MAYLVDVADQGDLRLEEDECALGVEALELGEQGCGGALRAADDVDLRGVGVAGELLQAAHAGAAGGTDEERDHAGRFGREAGVGAAHLFDADHLCGR